MNDFTLICQNEQRRHKVREEGLNGLDYLEVSEDQRRLIVYFLRKAPENLKKENVRITGGRRIRNIQIVDLKLCIQEDPERDDCMIVTVDRPGDFSTYTLCLVDLDQDGRPTDRPLPGFDPRYSCLDFSFKAGCPSDLDCKQQKICPPKEYDEPEINYLAKDYASFRQLILDRLALIMPDWQEDHVPDLGVALVELLAYVGDHISYYQDAVATEAYLDTARQRISVRRHARLVDYQMHEGCNARAWVCVAIDNSNHLELDPNDIYFITGYEDTRSIKKYVLTPDDLRNTPSNQYEVFEPLILRESDSPWLCIKDIKDPTCLALKLKHGQDDVSQYLQEQLSKETQELLDEYEGLNPPTEKLQKTLVDELNRVLQSDSLYSKKRFAQVTLTEEIQSLSQQKPQGEAFVRFNRSLLERTYPSEIAKIRKPDDPVRFYKAHNTIHFYTWGDRECCLPRGATTATLKDDWEPIEKPKPKSLSPHRKRVVQQPEPAEEPPPGPCDRGRKLHNLQPGDVLIFEEVIGPKTHNPNDADPTHRHAVRLTDVKLGVDPLFDQPIVEITWAEADALPFPLCISAIGPAPECELIENISVARGNVILVDHGRRVEGEALGVVSEKTITATCEGEGRPSDVEIVPDRFRGVLQKSPLTFSQPLPVNSPASRLLNQDPRQALPQVVLKASVDDLLQHWTAERDLLRSQSNDQHVVAEMDNEGRAHLRFGDGELGRMPEAGTEFIATYRVGNGPAGNVGAEAIAHIVLRTIRLSGVTLRPRNPLPARGGTAPESLSEVKLYAPSAFRTTLQRAIIADDYADLVMRDFKDTVQRAAAKLRWTGSWYEVLVAIDPVGEVEADEDLLHEIEKFLHRFRRIGHDVVVKPAQYVPLDIEITVCVLPDYLRGHVKAALLDLFSNRLLPDGRRGFFHPDNVTFGEGIFLSKLVAAAQAVAGVESIIVTRLERLFEGPNREIENGILPLGPFEIARLDNDPSFPENGRFRLNMRGGR